MTPKEYTDWLRTYLSGLECKNGIGKVHTEIIREKLQTVFVKVTPVNRPVLNTELFKKAVSGNLFGLNIVPQNIKKLYYDGPTYTC